MYILNRKIVVLIISIWVMSARAIAQDAWRSTLQKKVEDQDVRIDAFFKIDTSKKSFDITVRMSSANKNRPLERKLERLAVNAIRLRGSDGKIVSSELIKDSAILGGIHVTGNFEKLDPNVRTMPCYLALNYGKKEGTIELNYTIPIEDKDKDKEKDKENTQKALEEKKKADSIANAMRIKAEEDAAEEKRIEEERRKSDQKEKFQSLNSQLVNIEKEKQAIDAIQSAYNSFQQAAAASTPDQPNKVLTLKQGIELQGKELPKLLAQLQKLKTEAGVLSAAISATNFQNYHNKDQFINLQQSNSSIQKSITANEGTIQQLQSKFRELLSRKIFDRDFLDSTAEGKIFNELSPELDSLNSVLSNLNDSLDALMKFVSRFAGKGKNDSYNCDSLWKLYDLFINRQEGVDKGITIFDSRYKELLVKYKSALRTGKVDAIEQQLADLEKYSLGTDKNNKQLGARLNEMDCKPATKTRLPLLILGGALVVVLLVFFWLRYRKKRAEGQIKFLN